MYDIVRVGSNEIICRVENKEALMAFVSKECLEKNCGIYRHWIVDGNAYYDCGPIVYRVDADILK